MVWRTSPFVRSLPLPERMIYFELLDLEWDERGLPDEWFHPPWTFISSAIGCHWRTFAAAWKVLEPRFELQEDFKRRSRRLQEEFKKASGKSQECAKAAKIKHSRSANAVPNRSRDIEIESIDERRPEKGAPAIEPDPDTRHAWQVMKAWNALPGVSALLHNVESTRPLAAALAAVREAGEAAGKPVPSEQALLEALVRIAKRMAADGLQNVWQPKTLAKFVADAVLVANGEMDPGKKKPTGRAEPAAPKVPIYRGGGA